MTLRDAGLADDHQALVTENIGLERAMRRAQGKRIDRRRVRGSGSLESLVEGHLRLMDLADVLVFSRAEGIQERNLDLVGDRGRR